MKMNTDKDWLSRRAELEDGCFVSVGGLVESLAEREQTATNVVPMKPAFVRFVQLARRDRRLSLEDFAEKVDVDLAELVKIETEEHYKPTLRTVHMIAEFLKVPEKTLLGGCKLSCVNGHRKNDTKETRWPSTSTSSTNCWRTTRSQKTSSAKTDC